jgi:uncharacterized membrane protein
MSTISDPTDRDPNPAPGAEPGHPGLSLPWAQRLHRRWGDERIESIVGNLLRSGVLLAATVVLAGGLLFLAREGYSHPQFHVFRGEPQSLRTVSGVLRGTFHGQPRAIIQLGLLLLLATPIARVAFSAFAFALQGDRLYVAITLLVLAILLSSLSGRT